MRVDEGLEHYEAATITSAEKAVDSIQSRMHPVGVNSHALNCLELLRWCRTKVDKNVSNVGGGSRTSVRRRQRLSASPPHVGKDSVEVTIQT
jgi:hypothetical protein